MKQTILVILGCFAFQIAAQGAEVEKKTQPQQSGTIIVQPFSLDEIDKIEQQGYERGNGGQVKGVANGEVWTQEYCVINRDHFPARPVRFESCVIVINTLIRRDSNGKPVWKSEDAIQINFNGNNLNIFDSGDTLCASTLYPGKSVFAIGLWKWKKKPQVGGYAYSMRKAWLADPETRKLKEIPTNSVSCKIDEDRD